jgi:hypothetical protein
MPFVVKLTITRGSAFERMRTVDGMRLMEKIRMGCVALGEVGLRGAWNRCHGGKNSNSGLRTDKNRWRM